MSKYVTTIALLLFTSCQALTPSELEQYKNLINQGAEPVQVKNRFKAGALNLLPGVGDHFNENMEPFWLDVLTWPVSPTWAVPQALLTARNINRKATLAYYTTGEGKDMGFDPDETMATRVKINP